jgi:ribosomal protein S18 acetylase RimI-like enzyme
VRATKIPADVPEILDNIVWETLAGNHARFAVGKGSFRRFAPGFSPIVAFEDSNAPDFELMNEFCQPGESFYSDRWSGPVPDGWQVDVESTMFKMVRQGPIPEELVPDESRALGPEDASQALELALLTNPGPFGLRTLELGDYFGFFDGDRLVAMAGERMWAGPYREISGVCTHPDFQGRGLAKLLMNKLVRRALLRGQIPVLHVMSANELARSLYRRIGFEEYLETVVRVITRIS